MTEDRVAALEVKQRTFKAYKGVTDVLVDHFGGLKVVDTISTADFEALRKRIAETMGPVSIGNFTEITRVIFNYAYENELIDRPMRFGKTFRRPSRKVLRQARAKKGSRMPAARRFSRRSPRPFAHTR